MLCCVLPSHVWQFALKQISRDAKVAVCITTRELRIFREMCWLRFQTHVNSAHGCRALIYTHSTRGVCWLLSRSNRHSFRLWMLCVMGMWIYLYMLCEEHTSELSIEHQLDAGELIWNCQMVCVIRKLAAWKESVLRLCANTSLSSDVNWKLLFPLLTSLVSLHIYSIHMHYFHFGANARAPGAQTDGQQCGASRDTHCRPDGPQYFSGENRSDILHEVLLHVLLCDCDCQPKWPQ